MLIAWAGWCAAAALEAYGNVALPFERNVGQADARAQYLARSPGMQLFLAPTEATYRFESRQGAGVVRMALVGARPGAEASASERLPGHSNYLDGDPSRSLTHVPHYGRVEFAQVYRGIDLAYHGNGSRLEYDFIVAPGAHPRTIALDIQGADGLEIDGQGRLLMHTAAGVITWEAPLAYQERDGTRINVTSAYVMRSKNRIGFRVGKYDRTQPLVIDPILAYATLLGGTGHDHPYAIAVDGSEQAVISGQTATADFPTTVGAYDRTSGGIFVTKLNATGTALVYSTFLGPGRGTGVALQGGHAYVSGFTSSTTLATPGAFNNTQPGTNAFVAKLTTDGSGLEYAAIVGPGFEGPRIAVDAAGNAHIAGTTTFNTFPTTPGAFQATRPTATDVYQGDLDAYYAKLNPTGSALLYSTFLASTQNDIAHAIAVDANGMAYVTGTTQGGTAAASAFPTTASAYRTAFTGVARSFVAKFDPTAAGAASLVYSTVLGEDDHDFANAVAVDAGGNAYVTGSAGATYPRTPGAYGAPGGQGGAFVTKLNGAGSALVYSAIIAGAQGHRIALDSSGRAAVVGFVVSPSDFVPVNGIAGINGGDLFVARLDAPGTSANYAAYIEGHFDAALDIAIDPFDAVYVAGTAFNSFTTTPGAYQGAFASAATEAFVAKIVTDPPPVNRPPVANAGVDASVLVNQAFVLDGSASADADGDPLTYEWRDDFGTLVGTSSIVPNVTRPMGPHVFTLTVSDGRASDSDAVTVNVSARLGVDFLGGGTGTVASPGGDINCHMYVGACAALYSDPNTAVITLQALPDAGSFFFGWGGPCSGTAPCTLTVTNNTVVSARFDIQRFLLSIVNTGNGKVTSPTHAAIDCGTACTLNADYGTQVTLTATPDNGFLFDGWTGACVATTPTTCTVTMQAAQSVTASFRPVTVTGLSIASTAPTIKVGGQQRFTLAATFSDGSVREIHTDHAIEATDEETCAITRSGAVKCWRGPSPQTRPPYFGAVALAAGTAHTCALLSTGMVNCEGTDIPGAQGAIAIAASSAVTFAVTLNGTVVSWPIVNRVFLTPGNAPFDGLQAPATAIDVGAEAGETACVLLDDGRASCQSRPPVVPGVFGAVGITTGVNHACALVADGRVKCWGDNDRGMLGRGTTQPEIGYWRQPADFVLETIGGVNVPIHDAVGVVSGDYYSCALMRDTTVKCWGQLWSGGGQVGQFSTVALTVRKVVGPLPSDLADLTGVAAIGAGAFHACVAMLDGTANCWGTQNILNLGGIGGTDLAIPLPNASDLVAVQWTTQDSGVAAVMANGRVTGRSPGTTTVTATMGSFTATATVNVVANTVAGPNVTVTPIDATSQTAPVSVSFAGVTQPGATSVVIIPGPPPASTSSFGLGSPDVYYEISTTAGYAPPITVCIDYTGITFSGTPKLYHMQPGWTDVTTTVDTTAHIVCGSVNSLSPFALMVPRQCSEAPTIGSAAANPSILWPPNHKMTPVAIAVSAAGRCDAPVRCRIASVASNEPVDGLGDGDTAPDWQVTGDLGLLLRAERGATGSGRRYQVSLRCEDALGNAATRAVEVAVPIRR